MENKNITIDDSAIMVQKGFEGTAKDMKSGFDGVNMRLDKIENLILAEHRRRIEKPETELKKLKDMLLLK